MQMKVCFYFHFRVKWSLSHPSPVGTNGRCSAIAEGKQRVNQLTEQEGNSSRLSSSPFGEVGRGFFKLQTCVPTIGTY